MPHKCETTENMTDFKAELRGDIEELQDLLQQATRRQVQDMINRDINDLETLCEEDSEDETSEETHSSETDSARPKRYAVKLKNFGWYQTNKYIKIFVILKHVHTLPKDKVNYKLTDRSVKLRVEDLDNIDYVLTINKLLEPIDVELSQRKQKHDMVVIYLAKAHRNVEWSHITEPDKDLDEQRDKSEDVSSSSDEENGRKTPRENHNNDDALAAEYEM